jgi:hypothetical protein
VARGWRFGPCDRSQHEIKRYQPRISSKKLEIARGLAAKESGQKGPQMSRPTSRRRFLATTAGATAGAAAIMLPGTAGAAVSAPVRQGRLAAQPDAPGVSWPPGQVLPRFATPTQLDVANMTGVAADEQLLLTTLQGVVNRSRPRIYMLQPQNEGLYTWLDDLPVRYDVASNPLSLLTKYRGEITGAVLYDPAVPGTVNVATTLAGLHDAVATSAALATSSGLPVVADLRGMFTSDLDAYTWAVANLWSHTTHRMLIGLDPGISGYLRDYAVANRSLVVFLDPGVPAELALLQQVLGDIPVGSPYLGWWPSSVSGESDGTQVTSQYGLFVVASDWSANLTVLGGVQAPINGSQYHAPVPPLANKVYVTFTMTEGDNLQYNQHRLRQIWDDPSRGQVPLNWSVQPLGAEAAPTFLSYYQRTATRNDYLMAGPSGAGYAYPSWSGGTWTGPAWTPRSSSTGTAARTSRWTARPPSATCPTCGRSGCLRPGRTTPRPRSSGGRRRCR